ncbi:MAG TPA: sigma 54-interacting transcriptional regulator, partial [Holophaga sp.]|nr:sigma 54-interacting transcriptional regulator [Holophaga sp.]
DVAVTAGERQHVPAFVKQVVDIGGRVMDAGTIIDIATGLGLERLLQERRFLDYFSTLRTNPDRVTVLFNRTNILEEQISSLLDYLDDGLLMVGHTGLVHAGNRRAREILGTDMNVVGVRAADLFPGVPFARALKAGAGMGPTLVKLQGRDVSLKVVPIFKAGERLGALAIVNSFDAQEKVQQRLRSQLLGKGHRGRYSFEDILTQDPGLQEVKLAARRKAASDASVLISGETGTGKELFAHAIHNASPRKGWQFVTVNCAALPESLLESELFGYEEGAFTGARKGGKPGLFELAHKGTIFLDEIGEMDLGVQARLLRVLESREVMRIGGDRMIAVDIRIIAATNQDLWQRVEAGRFRKDLYYRLNVLPVQIPPLRARPGDIPFLLERLAQDGRARFEFTDEAHELLVHHAWPGNVRELKNLVDHLAILGSPVVEARDLAAILGRPPAPSAPLPP